MEWEEIFLNSAEYQQIVELIKGTIEKWWSLTPAFSIDNESCSHRRALEKFFEKTRANESQVSLINNYYNQVLIFLNQLNSSLKNYDMRISELEKSCALSPNTIRSEIEFLKKENKILREEIEQLKRQPITRQQSPRALDYSTPVKANNQQSNNSSSCDQTIDAFNAWAKNPGSALPSLFCYAEGDLKLREKQDIQVSSATNAAWIMNRTGPVKYLFPNPNVIDQLSGKIDTLYSVTGNRRARGQNKANVQKPCLVMEDGWIEYKGALSLI
jgi:hypothetical protein